jgi:hypothetical protein
MGIPEVAGGVSTRSEDPYPAIVLYTSISLELGRRELNSA